VQAFKPDPAAGAAGIARAAPLNWRPGRDAPSHAVYFGSDPNALADDTVTDHSYTPASLEFGTNYWWKVDEVTDVGTCPGEVWSFTTQEFASIDSFADYTDNMEAHETIWDAWIEGVTTEASGSQVGYTDAPFAEQLIVHGGKQSMPLEYDNSVAPFYSESEREFETTQDWMRYGADTLVLYVQGDASNSAEPIYVRIEDSSGKSASAVNGDGAVTQSPTWQEWAIPYSDLSGVNLSRVRKMVIGVGSATAPAAGGTGIVYVDDIGYGRPAAQ